MNAPLHSFYTNEVSPEFLRNLDVLNFNTFHGGFLLVGRESVPMADDFLSPAKQEEHP